MSFPKLSTCPFILLYKVSTSTERIDQYYVVSSQQLSTICSLCVSFQHMRDVQQGTQRWYSCHGGLWKMDKWSKDDCRIVITITCKSWMDDSVSAFLIVYPNSSTKMVILPLSFSNLKDTKHLASSSLFSSSFISLQDPFPWRTINPFHINDNKIKPSYLPFEAFVLVE